jgi:hypothetical protein
VVHLQNSRTTHGMIQPLFRSSQVRIATHSNSTHRQAHSIHGPVTSSNRNTVSHVADLAHALATTNHNSPHTPFLIGSSAIRNGHNSSVISVKSNSNRSKNACLCASFSHVLHSTNHRPRRTSRARLIASRQILEIHLTCSQQTRKYFLIASFCGGLAHACSANHTARVTNHCSPITLHQPLR